MSLAAMTWAVDAPINRPTAKLALVCLADHADENGACFPSQKALAERVGVTERALRDALAWLEEQGFISRTARHRKDGSRTSDAYQLPPEAYRKNFPHPRKQTSRQPEESSGLTTFEPPTEPPTTTVRGVSLDDLQEKVFKAAGIDQASIARYPKLLDLSPILGLLDAGYELEAGILAPIRASPNPKARSLAYFVPQITEAASRRSGIATAAKPQQREIDWSSWCQAFFASRTWNTSLGPAPDMNGCLAPPEVIETARRKAQEAA